MEAERLLTRRQGRGTFVNDQTSDELAARFTNLRMPDGTRLCGQVRHVEITEGRASDAECRRLRLRNDERVYRIHRVRHVNGQNYLVEDVALPAALFPDLLEKKGAAERIIGLAQEYGILLGKAEERISLEQASPTVAQSLGIAAGSPVMVLDRLVMSLDGRPIEWRVGRCHLADRYYVAEMA
jgi:GntR family transcriptional regulator